VLPYFIYKVVVLFAIDRTIKRVLVIC
jgi:hypothetical protein